MIAPGRWFRFSGDRGAMQTLARMRAIVNASLTAPPVRETAHSLAERVAVRDRVAQAWAIRDWLQGAVRFVSDPVGIEALQTPESMLKTISLRGRTSGDCDNAAVLAAAIAKAIGLRSRFVILGFSQVPGAPYQHVFTEVLTPQGWLDMDVTRPDGRRPDISRRYNLEV